MIKRIQLLFGRVTYIRYLAASIGALGVDVGLFLILINTHMAAVVASALGYSCGILAHWILSSRTVFSDRVSAKGTQLRTHQKAMFVISAMLGLVVTMSIVGAGQALGIDPRLAKIAAIIVSFQLTYMLRNTLIFRNN